MSWLSELLGGGSSTTTPQVAPELRQGLSNLTSIGSNLYYGGAGRARLPSTFIGPSDQTSMAIRNLAQSGKGGQPLYNQAEQGLAGIIGSTPVAGTAGLENIAQGANSIALPGVNPYGSQIANQQLSGPLADTASGALIGSNPYRDAVWDQIAQDVGTATKSQLNTRGLAGMSPGVETRVLSDRLADASTRFRNAAYETDMDRALSAGQFGAQFGAQNLGAAAGLAGQDMDRSIGVQGANIANQMGAAGLLGDLGAQQAGVQLSGIGALPGLASYGDRSIDQLLLAGQLSEGYGRSRAEDERNRFQYDQNRDWDLAQRYGNLLTGQPVGQTTTNSPGGLNTLGLGLAGLAAYPSIAAGGSALLGGLGSLAGAIPFISDRRAKTDIAALHTDDRGVKWYRFRYHWDDPEITRTGVMADEVPAHVVRDHPSGYKAVDYDALAAWRG